MRRLAAFVLLLSSTLVAQPDLSGLTIPRDQLTEHEAAPALTDPALESIEHARDWLEGHDPVLDVTVLNESVAIPLARLARHRVVNLTVAGRAVAAVATPETGTISLIARSVELPSRNEESEPEHVTLLLADSGLHDGHDTLLLDESTRSLWSQLGLTCVSGPTVGVTPEHLAVRVVTFERFVTTHPAGRVIEGGETAAFTPDPEYGAVGLGVFHAEQSWFVSAEVLGDGHTINTPAGPVIARRTGPGWVEVVGLARAVATVQTTLEAWIRVHPESEVVE